MYPKKGENFYAKRKDMYKTLMGTRHMPKPS